MSEFKPQQELREHPEVRDMVDDVPPMREDAKRISLAQEVRLLVSTSETE